MMFKKGVFIGFLLCCVINSYAQEIKGKVIDAKTGEALPLVNILYNENRSLGTVTDFNGLFTIPSFKEIGPEIQLSFIGYNTLTIIKKNVDRSGRLWVIKLEPLTETLQEVDLIAGENPALRIIRNAIAHRDSNNPKKYKSYIYHSYNKNVISYLPSFQDSLLAQRDTANQLSADNPENIRHLLILESVSKKYYKRPNKNKEYLLGTKISGFKEPMMGAVPDGFQSFGFYDNTIPMLANNYLNPIAVGADDKYFYILKDTAYSGNDTTFIMDFYPNLGSNFDGFEGEIHINTHRWAIEYVKAVPSDEGKLYIGMEQWYTKVDGGFWFPSKLSYDLVIEKLPIKGTRGLMHGDSYLDSVLINQPLNDSLFDHIVVEIDEDAGKKGDNYWETQRTEDLSGKEKKTYAYMDSIGNRYKFDAIMLAGRNAYDGFISFQNVDVSINKLVAYNDFEGLRLGLGLYTNQDISKKFKVGAYVGHGMKDKQWKYGASFQYFFKEKKDNNFIIEYLKDVRDPGGIRLKYWNNVGGFATQFLNVRMDNVEELGVYLNWRFIDYLQVQAGVRNFTLKPNYDYVFKPVYDGGDPQEIYYGFAEASIKFRWVYKEQFRKNFGQRVSLGSKYPVILFNYSRGLNGVGRGQFDYNKYEFGVQFDAFTKGLGRTLITIEAGYIDAPLPYSMNFSGRPSYRPGFSVLVKNTFQTMRFNEFSSTQYAALFFTHDFRALLFKWRYFKPEIRIFQAITYGSLEYEDQHGGLPFKTLEEGYFESGLVIDNILRLNMFNVGYFGIGSGVFYRYGPNKLPVERDNWTIKLAFMFSFN